MLKIILSHFISKDKALELLDDHEERITDFSEKNKHLAKAVKTGFKLWSIWRLFIMIWW
jgi:hypothetical protein